MRRHFWVKWVLYNVLSYSVSGLKFVSIVHTYNSLYDYIIKHITKGPRCLFMTRIRRRNCLSLYCSGEVVSTFNTLEAIISLLTFSIENSKPNIALDNRCLFFHGLRGVFDRALLLGNSRTQWWWCAIKRNILYYKERYSFHCECFWISFCFCFFFLACLSYHSITTCWGLPNLASLKFSFSGPGLVILRYEMCYL